MTSRILVLCAAFLVTTSGAAQDADPLAAAVRAHEQAAPVPLVERGLFVGEPAVPFAALSPDGRHVAYGVADGLATRVHVLDTASLDTSVLLRSAKLRSLHWSDDSDLLFLQLDDTVGYVSLDEPASPAYITKLDRSNRDYFLGPDHSSAHAVLVVRRGAGFEYVLERYGLDGEAEEIIVSDDKIASAVVADDGTAFVNLESGTGYGFHKIADGSTAPLFDCGLLEQCQLVSYDDTSRTLWLSGAIGEQDLGALYAYSLRSGELELIHSDPEQEADLTGFALAGGRPVLVAYHGDRLRTYTLDAGMAADLEAIDAGLRGGNVDVHPGDDAAIWLLRDARAVFKHPRLYLYDTETRRFTEILSEERNRAPAPPASRLSEKIPVTYRAGDGMRVHGYVSLPKGRPLAAAPMVTWVHGGPFSRVGSGYSGVTQFLVNRGYVVFEPNFRGSTGYGREYVVRSNKDFGDGVVQRDIIDGVEFLLALGIGDPERLAIAGGSFGGFSALAGLAFTPDLFKAGVASVPPADLAVTLRYRAQQPQYVNDDPASGALLETLVGDDDADLERLTRRSPQSALANVASPLLILAGAKDDRVPIAHVKEYALTLLNGAKDVSLLIDDDQGHTLESKHATLAYLYLLEEFLATYVGGRKQPLDDAAIEAYVHDALVLNSNDEFLSVVE